MPIHANYSQIEKLLGNVDGKKIAIWGLSFKPKTDDLREAPALVIIKELQQKGAKIAAFDPVAAENAKKILKDIKYFNDPYSCVNGCDCLVVCTEWDEFRYLSMERVKELMKQPNIIDGRNIYDAEDMKGHNINYIGVGKK